MALKKKSAKVVNLRGDQESRLQGRGFADLAEQLQERDITKRRWAARDLSEFANAIPTLLSALQIEQELVVQEALLDSLATLGGEAVVSGLIPLLRSEDPALRNGVIEILQSMPEGVAGHIVALLNDTDSDVRIFAIDILQALAHPQTPEWLLSVIQEEAHINVIATAVDRLAEVGIPEMVPALQALKQRFPDEAYLQFAIDIAIERIQGD